MAELLAERIRSLGRMSQEELRGQYQRLFGKEPPSGYKRFLWKRIAYRLQERDLGGLPPNLQRQLDREAAALPLKENPFRQRGPRPIRTSRGQAKRDRRLPMPGTVIQRPYKGEVCEVKVLDRGLEYQGKTFGTLTAVAQEITGSHWNGFLFFGLK